MCCVVSEERNKFLNIYMNFSFEGLNGQANTQNDNKNKTITVWEPESV
jgi:hypothetical protein